MYWGCIAHSKLWYNLPFIDLSFSVKNKSSKIISPVGMIHIEAKTIIHSSHQGTFHVKDGPEKKRSVLVEWYIIYDIFLYMRNIRGYFSASYLSPLLCISSVIFILVTDTNWLNSTLKHSAVSNFSVHYICIIAALFFVSYEIMYLFPSCSHLMTTQQAKLKMLVCQDTKDMHFHPFFKQWYAIFFRFYYYYYLQYNPTREHNLTNPLIFLEKLYSNYH